jgi:hypothetical protein
MIDLSNTQPTPGDPQAHTVGLIASAENDVKRAEAAALAEMDKLRRGPLWALILLGIAAIFVLVYLGWSVYHRPVPAPGVFSQAEPAVQVVKVEGPVLKHPLMVVPKKAVKKVFPKIEIPKGDEVVDTADIPAAENGVQTVTFMNMSSGTARTEYTLKPAPKFAFEGKNYVGVGYRQAADGAGVPVYFKRDVLQVKGAHLQAEVGDVVPLAGQKNNAYIGVNLEYRWGR